ncbi:MAG: 4-hydroxybenzoate octaprenyltransferase [Gammaproteobacteria bacterium]|nr:4-hydroxybenzoate octaprenyltransferase [Gammaproteobacteria bacterium]
MTEYAISERLRAYATLIRIERPIGILLLLWPALWALWIATAGVPSWYILAIFLLGVALMRSSGCAINDYADREIDGHVERTSKRPIATGLVSPKEALWVFVILSLTAFGLVLFLNWQTIALSFVAAFFASVYPFMKRYTHLPQLVLGMAFGWAVPMAFMAVTEQIPPLAWVLFVATVIWALIYDTEYAMVDREDDLKIGVKSTAILFGRNDRLIIGLLQLVMMSLLLWVGLLAELGVSYFIGLGLALLLALRQQWLIRNRSREGCFKAFMENNILGLVIFVGLFIDYL